MIWGELFERCARFLRKWQEVSRLHRLGFERRAAWRKVNGWYGR